MNQFFSNKVNEKILDKIYEVLIRIEKHLLEHKPKKEKTKTQLLNDKNINQVICLKRKFY